MLLSDKIQANLLRRKEAGAVAPTRPEPKLGRLSPADPSRAPKASLASLNDSFWGSAEGFAGFFWESMCTNGYGVNKGPVQGVFTLFISSFIMLPVVIFVFAAAGISIPSFLLPAITGLAIWAGQRKK